jgi:hypothetical protein
MAGYVFLYLFLAGILCQEVPLVDDSLTNDTEHESSHSLDNFATTKVNLLRRAN